MDLNRLIYHLHTSVQRLETFPRNCKLQLESFHVLTPLPPFSLTLSLSVVSSLPSQDFFSLIHLCYSISTTRSFNSNNQASYRRARRQTKNDAATASINTGDSLARFFNFFNRFATEETSCNEQVAKKREKCPIYGGNR